MRKRHSSIFTSGILVSSEAIIFTNESTLNNRRYYGGFEYVEKRHVTVVQQGEDSPGPLPLPNKPAPA